MELWHVNNEHALAMRTGFGNIDEIIIAESKLTSRGMQAVADAIIKREFPVKVQCLAILCFKLNKFITVLDQKFL